MRGDNSGRDDLMQPRYSQRPHKCCSGRINGEEGALGFHGGSGGWHGCSRRMPSRRHGGMLEDTSERLHEAKQR
eukprot:6185933-Pleurochrysis_carterae.AAC.3